MILIIKNRKDEVIKIIKMSKKKTITAGTVNRQNVSK